MKQFARLDIGAGRTFDASKFSPEIRTAIHEGIADAWQAFKKVRERMDAGEVTSGEAFGTRAHLKNNDLYRMLAAVIGI